MGHSSKQASIVWFNKILAFSVGIATCPSHRLRRKYGESSIFIECLHRRRCEVCHTCQKDRAPRSFNKKARFRFRSQSARPSRIAAKSPSRHSLAHASPPIEAVMDRRSHETRNNEYQAAFTRRRRKATTPSLSASSGFTSRQNVAHWSKTRVGLYS